MVYGNWWLRRKRWRELWKLWYQRSSESTSITGSYQVTAHSTYCSICMKDKDVWKKFSCFLWKTDIIHLFFVLKYWHFMLLMDEIPESSHVLIPYNPNVMCWQAWDELRNSTGCANHRKHQLNSPAGHSVSGAALSFCAGATSGVRHTGEMGGRNPKANHLSCMKPCK